MLQHIRQEQLMRLTVDGRASIAAAVVAQDLRHALIELQRSFGVQFRFEVECEYEGERAFWPLDYLPFDHEFAKTAVLSKSAHT